MWPAAPEWDKDKMVCFGLHGVYVIKGKCIPGVAYL